MILSRKNLREYIQHANKEDNREFDLHPVGHVKIPDHGLRYEPETDVEKKIDDAHEDINGLEI